MLHPSTKRLIDKLSEMTRKQRVTWTEGENGTVVHDTEGYRVVLTPEPHAVLLTDALGREIESCRPEEFADDVDSHGRPYAKFVSELYREAHRHARGTEKAIRTLLAGLDATEEAPPAGDLVTTPAVELLDAPHAATDETTPGESETEITAAVATLADQINTPPAVHVMEPAPEVSEPEPVASEPVVEAAMEAPVEVPVEAPLPEAEIEASVPVEQAAEPELPEEIAAAPEPSSFGTFGSFAQQAPEAAPEPAPEPFVAQAEPEPAPQPVPEPEPVFVAPPEPEAEPVIAAEPEAEPELPPPPVEPPAPPRAPTLAQPISLSSIPFGFGLGAAQRPGAPSHPSTSSPPSEPAPAAEAPRRVIIDGTVDLPDVLPESYGETVTADAYPPSAPEPGPRDVQGENTPSPPEPGNPRRFNPWN